ncbi:MAG: protein kinase [archaeon]|nr:protein kinase [archaeon]
MASSDPTKTPKDNKAGEIDPNAPVVEENIIKVTGDIQKRKYYKGRLLGKGGFAKCYEFICAENKKIFAAKVVAKSSLVKSRAKQKLISEIKIHKSLHHPQIVAFEHYFEDTENVYILLEMCQNQTLNELLKRRKRLTELEVQCYVVQLIKALKYLHAHRVIHRDLKLGNLFLTDKMELKVGDFGLATKLDFEGERKRTVCGTPNYIAPEILDGKTGHSYEVDIWSLGVIIYTLIIGKPPFETQDVKTTYKRIKMNAYSFPDGAIISEAAKSLIIEILVTDPSKRPSLDQILSTTFFNQGTSIPKLLPTSTLACTPSLSYIRQFLPDAGPNGIVVKAADHNHMKMQSDRGVDIPSRPMTTNLPSNKGIGAPSGINTNNPGTVRDGDKKEFASTNPNSAGNNLIAPDTWVKKWVDYSSKYGLGYLLSNGFTGVFFNDSSKIILDPKTNNFNYIERRVSDKQEIINSHTLSNYPKELQKKVTLLQHFKSYLEGDNTGTQPNFPQPPKEESTENKDAGGQKPTQNFIYVKKWMRTRHAIMFRLCKNNYIIYY